MVQCKECGESTGMPFKCKFCGDNFCPKHRLPEGHNCLGLANIEPEKLVYEPNRAGRSAKQVRVKRSASLGPAEGKITFILLGITVFIFIIQLLTPGSLGSYAFDPLTAFEEPWTFVTSVFLHGSYGHLFFNMFFLFLFGILLERKIGSMNFILFYLAAGIVANLGYMGFEFAMGGNINSAIGASGALYGVFAALAILEPSIVVYPMFFPIPVRIQYALVIFAIIDIAFLSFETGIARAAHLTGIIAGLAYAFWLKQRH